MKKIIIVSVLLVVLLSVSIVDVFSYSHYICDDFTCYQVNNIVSNSINYSGTTTGDILTYISDSFKGFLNIPISNILFILFVFVLFIVFLFLGFLFMDVIPGLSLFFVCLSILSFFFFVLL